MKKKCTKVVLTSTHNICFRGGIRKSFNPVNLTFPNINGIYRVFIAYTCKEMICRLAEAVG